MKNFRPDENQPPLRPRLLTRPLTVGGGPGVQIMLVFQPWAGTASDSVTYGAWVVGATGAQHESKPNPS